jgi:hypothetical protein
MSCNYGRGKSNWSYVDDVSTFVGPCFLLKSQGSVTHACIWQAKKTDKQLRSTVCSENIITNIFPVDVLIFEPISHATKGEPPLLFIYIQTHTQKHMTGILPHILF